jgi:hypothetical protein
MSSDPPSVPSLFPYSPKGHYAGVIQRIVVAGELHRSFLAPRPLVVCDRSRDEGGTWYKGVLISCGPLLGAWSWNFLVVALSSREFMLDAW